MKAITLCGINARYSHSNLALRCLKYAAQNPDNITISEHSINERVSPIAHSIVRTAPDAVGFSCYIWNIEHVLKVASTVKRILPGCVIFFGGPEVSHNSAHIMASHPFVDMIIKGEGELPFAHLKRCLDGDLPIDTTPSACIRRGGDIITTADAPPFEMDSLPFMYGDLSAYQNKVIYYETSRGCPYRCAYCMSANVALKFLPLARVKDELEHFIKANVRQVKLVDRTFNHPQQRAYEIFKALIALSEKHPESRTQFHFEIAASLLDDRTLSLLSRANAGLLQFEIGIQSTNADTLKAVNRHHDTQTLLAATDALCRLGTVCVHVDLIAGLPCETPESFTQSFNDAYTLDADALQLGFLKMLPGAPILDIAKAHGIVHTAYPPYEVLHTNTMPYDTLTQLHLVSRLVDTIYNTGHFKTTLSILLPAYASPFALYSAFAAHLDAIGFFSRPQKIAALFDQLYLFAKDAQSIDSDTLREALIFDWLCLEKPKTWPQHLADTPSPAQKAQHRRFFVDRGAIARYLPGYASLTSSSIASRCVIRTFGRLFPSVATVLFDYGKKRHAQGFWQFVTLGDDG